MSKTTKGLAAAAAVGLAWTAGIAMRTTPEKAAQGNAQVFEFEDGGLVDVSAGVHKIRQVKPLMARPDGGSGKREDLFRFGGVMCDRSLLSDDKASHQRACWRVPARQK